MKKYIRFPSYMRPPTLYKRLYHHIQGFSHAMVDGKPVPVLARDGHPHGEIIIASGTWGGFTTPEPHVGGIDTLGQILAVPSHDPDEWGGFITLYDMLSRKRIFRSDRLAHKCYACGVEFAGCGDDELLVAVVSAADGSRIDWYHTEGSHTLHHIDSSGLRAGPKNNITLRRIGGELFLFEMRAGWPHDLLRRREVIEKPCIMISRSEQVAEVRSGWCGVRWGATIRFEDNGDYLMKTARNIFRGRLRVVENRIEWRSP